MRLPIEGVRSVDEVPRMTAVVRGTGVAVRLATDEEVRAVASSWHGRELVLTPSRGFLFSEPRWPLAEDEALVDVIEPVPRTAGAATSTTGTRWRRTVTRP